MTGRLRRIAPRLYRDREQRPFGDGVGERRSAPRGENGFGELGHRGAQPRRAPLPERDSDQAFAPEMQRRLHAVEREMAALFDRRAPLVQLRQLALGGKEDRADGAAGGAGLGELRFELGRPAGKYGVDKLPRTTDTARSGSGLISAASAISVERPYPALRFEPPCDNCRAVGNPSLTGLWNGCP